MARKIPGIHIQWPWSRLLLDGRKTVETRGYDLPQKHLGKELALIETPGPRGKGDGGVSSSQIIGTIVFIETFRYANEAEWQSDYKRHLVDASNKQFSFQPNKEKWGWVVGKVTSLQNPKNPPKKRGIVFATECLVD